MANTVPHSLETEQYTLALLLNDEQEFVSKLSVLAEDDFHLPQHRDIFNGLKSLQENGGDACTIGVYEYIKSIGNESVTSLSYIMSLANLPIGTVTFEACFVVLREKKVLRSVYEKAKEHMELSSKGEGLDELFEKIRNDYSSLEKEGMGECGHPLFSEEESLQGLADRVDLHNKGIRSSGLPTGFDRFDDMVGGLSPSHLIISAGRPGMGKTALALNILENLVFKYKKPVGFFSLEMSSSEVFDRIISSLTLIPLKKIRTGCLTDTEMLIIKSKLADVRNEPFIIDDSAYQTISGLSSKAIAMKKKYDISAIVIDYLQLISGTRKSSDSRYMEITDISRKLKCLAKHLNVPVVCLSQLSRSVEQRVDKTPQLSDLRDSGAIEQDADIVCFIFREDYYDPFSDKPGKIIVSKNRHGSVGSVDVLFNKNICQFKEKKVEI